jgi:hypothetical protein
LTAGDPDLRYTAVKWIADDVLKEYRGELENLLDDATIDFRLFLAVATALDRLDGKEPEDRPNRDLLLKKIADDSAPTAIRRWSLRLIDPSYKRLKLESLVRLIGHPDDELRLESVRTLAQHPSSARFDVLSDVMADERQPPAVRATAVAGLAANPAETVDLLVEAACQDDRVIGDEALRALIGAPLSPSSRRSLGDLALAQPETAEAVQRLLHGKLSARPAPTDIDAWLKLTSAEGDPVEGERVFFAAKIGTCSRCHQKEGRGNAVGPDLTIISRRLVAAKDPRRWLLETLLLPSKEMAPQYTPWTIVTVDGQTFTGLPRRKGGNAEAYLGVDGKEFTLRKDQIEFHRETSVSIMPNDLLQQLTLRELSDLLAYLEKPR